MQQAVSPQSGDITLDLLMPENCEQFTNVLGIKPG